MTGRPSSCEHLGRTITCGAFETDAAGDVGLETSRFMASLVNLTDWMREYLVHEFGTVAFQLADTLGDDSRLEYAVYWYSAAFGAVQRVINFEPDGELFLLHSVLQSTHEQLTNRLRRQLAGEENPVSLLGETYIMTLSQQVNWTCASNRICEPARVD